MIPKRSLQVAAWLLLFTVAAFTVVSPDYRVSTFLPHDVEHFIVFLFVGLAFGFGYASRYLLQLVALLSFTAAIELAQLWAPGRHARLSDFIVDALAVGIGLTVGIGLAYVVAPRQKAAQRDAL